MTWIQLSSGKPLDLLDPKPEQISIEDIASMLGRICRYNGATTRHYSVATHCAAIAAAIYRDTGNAYAAMAGLIHDSPEHGTGDITRPMKLALMAIGGQGCLDALKDIEDGLMAVILERFDLPYNLMVVFGELVKEYDNRIVNNEKMQFMADAEREWSDHGPPLIVAIPYEDAEMAAGSYIAAFKKYQGIIDSAMKTVLPGSSK